MPSRQPSSRPTVRNWIGVGGTASKSPSIATPQVFSLKPPVCAPSTGLVHAAGPALEHLPVLVDQRVVGDVAPAQRAGVVRVDRPDDRRRILRRVVVAARGVVHDAGPNPVVVHGVRPHRIDSSAPHWARLMMLGGWPGGGGRGRQRHWLSDRRLRRADQHRVDVLPERLFDGGRACSRGRASAVSGCDCCGADAPCAARPGHRDLHGGGEADEHRFGAARSPTIRRRRPSRFSASYQGPQEPSGLLRPHPRRRAAQVRGGQRDERERCVLVNLANRLTAADAGQWLLSQPSLVGERASVVTGRRALHRPRQYHHGRRDRGEQHRRCTTGRHGLMLRMCLLLPVFRHGRSAAPMSCNGTAEPATWLLRCRLGGRTMRPAGRAGTGGTGGAGMAPGFIADVIIGITTPLSRSIAWPAPNCCAALLRSPRSPPEPVLGAAPSDDAPRESPPMIGYVPAGEPTPSRPMGAAIGTSPGAGRPTPLAIGVVASAGSAAVTGGVVRPPGVAPVGLVSAGLAAGSVPVSAGLASASEPSAGTAVAGSVPRPVVVRGAVPRPGVVRRSGAETGCGQGSGAQAARCGQRSRPEAAGRGQRCRHSGIRAGQHAGRQGRQVDAELRQPLTTTQTSARWAGR